MSATRDLIAAAPDMAEVERLLEAYDREYASGGSVEDYDRARTTLLDYVRGVLAERDALIAAHAGATKKMARDERQLFESWIVRECGPGETKRWLNTEVYENMRVNDYRTGWVACLGLMSAAPQPVSAAEVPMPEPDCVTFSRTPEGFGVRVDAMRMDSAIRYGDAREAAGYARGLKEVNTALNDVFSAADGLSSAIDAALRGEVKP